MQGYDAPGLYNGEGGKRCTVPLSEDSAWLPGGEGGQAPLGRFFNLKGDGTALRIAKQRLMALQVQGGRFQ